MSPRKPLHTPQPSAAELASPLAKHTLTLIERVEKTLLTLFSRVQHEQKKREEIKQELQTTKKQHEQSFKPKKRKN